MHKNAMRINDTETFVIFTSSTIAFVILGIIVTMTHVLPGQLIIAQALVSSSKPGTVSGETKFNDQGSALIKSGKVNESIPYFDQALAINPNSFNALYHKGVALLLLKAYSDSLPYFDKALAINPNFYPVLYNKGFDLLVLGKYNDSIPYFDKAILKKPDYSFPLIGKGIALVKLGKYSESIPIFDKALAINPKDINALNYKKLAVAASIKKS